MFTYLRSNITYITSKIFHSVLGAEISRIAKSANKCNEFKTSSKTLINRTQNQGGNAVVLKRTLSQHFDRYSEVFQSSMICSLHS